MEEILELFRDCSDLVVDEVSKFDKIEFGKYMGMGADGTPIKAIDDKAESKAIEYFKENCDYSILSEESGLIEGSEEGTIIMDPIDGTSNAVMGIPFYGISLAFTEGSLKDTTVGYVKNIPLDIEYWGIEGKGSYVDDKELKPKLRDDWNFSVYMGKKAHPDCFRVASIPRRTRSLGSASLEICMVAEGVFDLYYLKTPDRQRSLRITDIAAATLILKEAGGMVYDGGWDELDMSLDPAERRDVIALYNEKVKEAIE